MVRGHRPGRRCPTKQVGPDLSLSFRVRVFHPNTRKHVRLLGPCFKTGRLKPLRQHPKRVTWVITPGHYGALRSSIPTVTESPG